MIVKQFKFRRNNDKGGFRWTAHFRGRSPWFLPWVDRRGQDLADVKEFAALVRVDPMIALRYEYLQTE